MEELIIRFWNIEIILKGNLNGSGTIKSNLKLCTTKKEVDVLESLILAHFCAGIDVSSTQYVTGLQTTIDALGNQA